MSEGTAYDAVLVISELVTNSVEHPGVAAGAPVQLRADLGANVLRLEVGDLGIGTDTSECWPMLRRPARR